MGKVGREGGGLNKLNENGEQGNKETQRGLNRFKPQPPRGTGLGVSGGPVPINSALALGHIGAWH